MNIYPQFGQTSVSGERESRPHFGHEMFVHISRRRSLYFVFSTIFTLVTKGKKRYISSLSPGTIVYMYLPRRETIIALFFPINFIEEIAIGQIRMTIIKSIIHAIAIMVIPDFYRWSF